MNNNIDVNELVNALNGQIATMNLELTVSKIQISNLQKMIAELQQQLHGKMQGASTDDFVTPSAKSKTK